MVGLFLSFIANVAESSGNEKSIVNILKQPLLEKKKCFRLENFVNVHVIIEHLKISCKIGRSFHKLSCKSGGNWKKWH